MSINWRGDLEWSDGSPLTLAPYDNPDDAYRSVTACPQWLDVTGDAHVSVDPKTGKILGCENDGYPHVRNKAENPPVYLHLFHGRRSPDAEMEGWGFNGPTIGPLDYVHVTYMCDVKFSFQDQHDAAKFGLPFEGNLKIVDSLIEHDGAFYGDFSINAFKCTGLYRIDVIHQIDGVVHTEKFDATELEAERRLGEVWNSNWAGHSAGRYKAVLLCISGDGEAIRDTIEPEGDDD